MALRLDSIRSIPSSLGLLLPEEIWLQLINWGAVRTRNRCGLGSCSAGVGFYLLQLRVTGPAPGSRQGTCSFSLGGSLYYSCIKFVNGLTLPLWSLTL